MKKIIQFLLIVFVIYVISKATQISTSPSKEVARDYPNSKVLVSGNKLITEVISDMNVQVFTTSDKEVNCETNSIYIVCGRDFINTLTPEQLVLILLHEYGHIIGNDVEITSDFKNTLYIECKKTYSKDYCINEVKTDLELLYMQREQEYKADMYAYNHAINYNLNNSVCDYMIDYIDYSHTDDTYDTHPLTQYRYDICKFNIK